MHQPARPPRQRVTQSSTTGTSDVQLEDVRSLLAPGDEAEAAGTADLSTVPDRWEALLHGLGHDLDAADDPVARLWKHLRTEHRADLLSDRREPALTLGLDTLLGAKSYYRITI